VTPARFHPPADARLVAEVVAELERAGYRVGDQMRLRFCFAAPQIPAAVGLARALRGQGHKRVQVRPAPRRLLTAGRWSVMVTTPAAPLLPAIVRLWEELMLDLAGSHAGCTIVGWRPLVSRAPADVDVY
jgi:hypothetical protein